MVTTKELAAWQRQQQLDDQLAELAAHLNAATARWLDLVLEFRSQGGAAGDDFAHWLAWRCGISPREAREYLRVADALHELPLIGAAFRRGELSFCKLRALTRVATPASEPGLLELAGVLTASQLGRALRAFLRVRTEQARDSHQLECVDYYWEEDGSLVLRARLPAEDGTLLVRALEAARDNVIARRKAEQETNGTTPADPLQPGEEFEPPRSLRVEAFVELTRRALAQPQEPPESERPRLVVHVDAAALGNDGPGRCELEDGPVIAPETARRLGCDAEHVASVERDGLPVSVGRARRSAPPALRRLLEARDQQTCRWPGCERRRHLAAHHRVHWARGGETNLDNLVLLCFHHHRLVHEGGYTIENGPQDELRFRNRHGILCPASSRPPSGTAEQLVADNHGAGLQITRRTNRNGAGERMNLALTVDALIHVAGAPGSAVPGTGELLRAPPFPRDV
jgi:hypothetical protein